MLYSLQDIFIFDAVPLFHGYFQLKIQAITIWHSTLFKKWHNAAVLCRVLSLMCNYYSSPLAFSFVFLDRLQSVKLRSLF